MFYTFSMNAQATNSRVGHSSEHTYDPDVPTTLIVVSTSNPENVKDLQVYVEKVMPLFYAIHGRVVNRSKINHAIKGEAPGEYLLVMDFPSKQSLLELFESKEYKALIPWREKGFRDINVLFADEMK